MRVCNDVGVDVVGEMEADGNSLWSRRGGVIIGGGWHPRRQ